MNVPAQVRPDGRCEAFDISPGGEVKCFECVRRGYHTIYKRGQAFLVSAANHPFKDGKPHYFCHGHLPDNTVLVDPLNNYECRDKDGRKRWFES
jgi:hypothetical protein